MKALVCSKCNSIDIIERDDKYVCNYCGTVYTSDMLRKLIVSGRVSIDDSQEVENLLTLARRAKADHNHDFAAKCYEKILVKSPMNWEAYFYATYFSALSKKITELSSAATNIRHSISQTLQLLNVHCDEAVQITQALDEIYTHCCAISDMLYLCNHADREDTPNDSCGLKDAFCCAVCNLFLDDRDVFYPLCTDILKRRLEEDTSARCAEKYREAIRVYEPNYGVEEPEEPKKRAFPFFEEFGCYIATAVYGSYDCPPVWTLRRFRDNQLAANWFGRCFIRIYYAVSPHLVRHLGKHNRLCSFIRRRLDRFVSRLQARGYEDSPYDDPVQR